MKSPLSLSLSDRQRRLLIRVAAGSAILFLSVVAVVWVVRYLQVTGPLSGDSKPNAAGLRKHVTYLLPIDITAHRMVARRHLRRHKPHKAIAHLKRCLYYDADDIETRALLATAYLRSGAFDKAADAFSALQGKKMPDSLASLVCARHGLTLYYAGRIDESIATLGRCIEDSAHHPEALTYMGQIAAGVTVLSSGTDTADTVRSREGVPLHSPNTYFTHAIQADPYYAEARYQQARFFMNRGRYKTARDSLRRLLSIFPAHARAHARLGMIYYYLNQPQMAAQAYRTALTINPDDYNTHYNLGELYYSTDRTHKALAQFKKALSLRPAHVQANFKTGLIALNNGMVNEAIRYLTRAAEHDKDNIRILLQLAVAYERQDSPEKALRVYRRITGIDPLNRIALQKIDMLSADAQTRR